ncbi:MAG: hypothetical protein IKP88_17235 [Lachnospiraceae bacterium]|nr:hypothetical protein [Lachnospiraceae bacterium]
MKKIRVTVICIILVLVMGCFTGCSKYTSSWSASAFIHSNTPNNALMSFWKFSGTIVHTLVCKDSSKEVLNYSANLKKGKITVYYDDDGTKKELFTIKEGEEITSEILKLHEGTVYVIVETDGECENGELEFNIK